MSSKPVIQITNLTKRYPIYERPHHRLLEGLFGSHRYRKEFVALDGISFEVARGETIGIIGKNGSGKSTLLQLICGTLTPSEGSVAINGRIAALLELGAGFNPEFTGIENVYLYATILGLSRGEIDQRLEAILAFADIGDFVYQPVKTYSSGMYVRLAFAVVAHVDADILVVDEALAVGDAFFTQKCMRFLRRFRENGTILFVSHDSGAVVNLCDRAIWLDHGQMQLAGDAKTVCERYLAANYNQGSGALDALTPAEPPAAVPVPALPVRDQRLDWLNVSPLRNDIEVFSFDPSAEYFGTSAAHITSVMLLDEAGHPLSWVVGGELVQVRIAAHTRADLERPIIGFLLKDRLGQFLFGDNTFLSHQFQPVATPAGGSLQASFQFRMPILPPGDYSLCAALSDGTQDHHVVHQWIHDAILLKSHSSSVTTGLLGIPMQSVTLART
ncbi:ABC transporter ATP-binding protein [Chitinimonas naiadis]